MLITLFIITVLFAGIGFSSSHEVISVFHPISTYVITLITVFLNNLFLTSLGCIGLLIFLMIAQKQKDMFIVKVIKSILFGLTYIIAGEVLSFILLFFIAFIHLNVFSLFMRINGQSLGILTNPKTVIETIIKTKDAPTVVIADPSNFGKLVALAQTTSGSDNFYSNYILSFTPSFLVLPLENNTSSMMFLDNTLILSGVSARELRVLGPVLGHAFLQKYFWNRNIIAYPKVTFMTQEQYQNYRKNDIVQKQIKLGSTIVQLESVISSVSASIKEKTAHIEEEKAAIKNGFVTKDIDYKNCLRIQKNSETCKTLVATADALLRDDAVSIQTLTQTIAKEKIEQNSALTYKAILSGQHNVLQTRSENVPHELGIFEPKNAIKLIFNTKTPAAFTDFLATLTHEYLHYASYQSDQQVLHDSFFEEGLTEYFTRRIMQQEVGSTTNIGYPVQVKIITEMTRIIPESEFADIYFSKDQRRLEDTLNRVYGDNFYETTAILFTSLQYSSDPVQTLQIANDIMKKIGGKKLTGDDLESSFNH